MENVGKKHLDREMGDRDPDMTAINARGLALTESGVFLGAGALPPPIGAPPVSIEEIAGYMEDNPEISAQEQALQDQIGQNKQGEN
jgi:hypothetical protein